MRLNCGPTREEREAKEAMDRQRRTAREMEWHDHFCWLPVRMSTGECRWLETVERRLLERRVHLLHGYDDDTWEYRAKAHPAATEDQSCD